jgi:hypothetical protein
MRKLVVLIVGLAVPVAAWAAAPSAGAEPPCGAIECPEPKPKPTPKPPKPPDCNQNGIIVCSAGDVLVKDLP